MVKEATQGASGIITMLASDGNLTGIPLAITLLTAVIIIAGCFVFFTWINKKKEKEVQIHKVIDTTVDLNASVNNIENIFTNNYLSITASESSAVKATVSSIQLRKRKVSKNTVDSFYKNEILGKVLETDIREILLRVLPNSIEIVNKCNNEIEKLAATLISEILRKIDFYAAAELADIKTLEEVIRGSEKDIYNELLSLKTSIENRLGILRKNIEVQVGR